MLYNKNIYIKLLPLRLIIFLILTQSICFAKIKIVTSITPLASITSMLLEDLVEVISINNQQECPHNLTIRPSDITKILNAELVIYIDDNFELFIPKILKNYNGLTFKVSDITVIDFAETNSNQPNWHFWLDLNNVMLFQQKLSTFLINHFPKFKEEIIINLIKSQKKINILKERKKKLLNNVTGLLVLSDSLEHFFKNEKNITSLYQAETNSIKSMTILKNKAKSNAVQCLVIGPNQNPSAYKVFNKKIIQLDSENWKVDKKQKIHNLFEEKYLELINQLKTCTPYN